MVRTCNLVIAAATSFAVATTIAGATSCRDVAFNEISASNFQNLFNREVKNQDVPGKLVLSRCHGRHCAYRYESIAIVATPIDGGEALDGLTLICGSKCQGADFILGILVSLRALAPGLSTNQYGAWSREAGPALKGGEKYEGMVGPLKLSISTNPALGVVAFITQP